MYYIIVDIDGTIVDNNHRVHLIPLTDKDNPHAWVDFNNACLADEPIQYVIDQVKYLYQEIKEAKLVFITSRCLSARTASTMQLMDHFGLYPYSLLMRPMDNRLSPADYKKEVLYTLLSPDDAGIIFDDHPDVIKMVKDHYLNLIPVFIDSQCCSVTK